MSEPHEPTPSAASGQEPQPQPPQAGAQPPTESEPAPSAAPPAEPAGDRPTEQITDQTAQNAQVPPPPPNTPGGHYVFVPAGTTLPKRRFGPAVGRFVRNRATHLVAAVVVGAVVGGGTVAIVDNAANHQPPQFSRIGAPGGPFGGGGGHRFPGFGFGGGGQGSGN